MSILVVGGAGYIGSHTVKYLQEKKEHVIVVDNLQSGHRESINVDHFYKIDIREKKELSNVFKKTQYRYCYSFCYLFFSWRKYGKTSEIL
jgi:UDP-glucose 4-epimerase